MNDDKDIAAARAEVGAKLFGRLQALETYLQLAAEAAGEFSADLARAPREANLSLGYGQGVVSRVAQVQPLLADARGHIFFAHQGLERIGKDLQVSVRTVDTFNPFSTPADKPPPPPTGVLEVVPLEVGRTEAA